MRRLLAVSLTALVALYAAVASRLFIQNRWAEELPTSVTPSAIHHPEAVLALAQFRFANNRFRDEELELVKRALSQLPSFYEPHYLLATFYASRLERPDKIRAAFDAALSRYPANGRLQLAYGSWLLDSRQTLPGWQSTAEPGDFRDPLPDAELHLKAAMELEPDLSGRALSALSRNRVPSARWYALVPDTPMARTSLLDALFQAGEVEAVWAALESGALPSDDPNILGRIIQWGLRGDRPDLALEAALAWQMHVERAKGAGPDVLTPALWVVRAHLALGDEAAAYDSAMATLDRIESGSQALVRSSLDFLCAVGDEYLRRGLVATAEVLFGQAASRSRSHVPALIGLARSFAQSGDDLGAVEQYEEALRVDSSNEVAGRELKALLLKMNR